ncbi:MAG: hypothetical protein ACRCZP_10245 [Phycicoccus sp.]
MDSLRSLLALDTLLNGLRHLADVRHAPLGDRVAHLDHGPDRPVLTLDTDSSVEQQLWAAQDALRELGGLGGAQDARPVRRLRTVS